MNARNNPLGLPVRHTLAIALILAGTSLSLCAGETPRAAGARGDARPPGNGAQVEKERTEPPSRRESFDEHRGSVASDIRKEIAKRIRIIAAQLGIPFDSHP